MQAWTHAENTAGMRLGFADSAPTHLVVCPAVHRLSSNPDPTLQKYLQRIQTKLQAASGGAPVPITPA